MSRPVVTCHVNDPLNVPAALMWDHDCGAIPVIREEGKLAGMITDRDICMAAFTQGRRLDEILVNSVMSKQVISVPPDQMVEVAEQLMAKHQVRRLPVIDSDGKPIGILSLNNIAIESVQPDTSIENGLAKVAHALAAICLPHVEKRKVA